MLKRLVRRLIVGTRLEPVARSVYSRVNRSCAESTAEMRDNPQMKAIMGRVLQADSCCLDIGAHAGDMLSWMVSFAPRGEHHAFEPIPSLAEALVRNFPQVRVHQVALSDGRGTACFNYYPDSPGHSSLKAEPGAGGCQSIEVKVEVLDGILPPDYRPTLIKIDVEGAEYLALRGGLRMLKSARPFILFEFGKSATRFDVTPARMHQFLCEDLGLKISRLNDWLDGRSALSRAQFERIFRQDLVWNFVAHPH